MRIAHREITNCVFKMWLWDVHKNLLLAIKFIQIASNSLRQAKKQGQQQEQEPEGEDDSDLANKLAPTDIWLMKMMPMDRRQLEWKGVNRREEEEEAEQEEEELRCRWGLPELSFINCSLICVGSNSLAPPCQSQQLKEKKKLKNKIIQN